MDQPRMGPKGNVHKRLALVEFPGILRDLQCPGKAIEALGGEDAVRAGIMIPVLNTAPRLAMNLRPGVDSSRSNILAEKLVPTANVFLLKITGGDGSILVRNEGQISNAQSCPGIRSGEFKPTGAAVEDCRLSLDGTLIGQVTATTHFKSLCDFQYHPRKNQEHSRNAMSTSSTGIADSRQSRAGRLWMDGCPARGGTAELEMVGNALFHVLKNYQSKDQKANADVQIDRLRPPRFARVAIEYGNADYWFRQYGEQTETGNPGTQVVLVPGRPIGDDRRSDVNRLGSLYHRVRMDVRKVPIGPHPSIVSTPVARGRATFDALHVLLQSLFEERPIWLRRALYEGIPIGLRRSFKRVISMLAYCFQGAGPFYQAWIRYGYDPRTDPSARQYQVIEVRCNHPVIVAAVDERYRTERPSQNLTDGEFELSVNYTLSEVPTKKNLFAQVCDIQFPGVLAVCREVEPTPIFDMKYGFFSEAGCDQVISAIKQTLLKMSEEFIGEERVNEVMREYRGVNNRLLKKRRRRISLKEVMKPGVGTNVASMSETRLYKQMRRGLDEAGASSLPNPITGTGAELGDYKQKGIEIIDQNVDPPNPDGSRTSLEGPGSPLRNPQDVPSMKASSVVPSKVGLDDMDKGSVSHAAEDGEKENCGAELQDVEGYEIFGDDEYEGDDDEYDE